MPAETLRPFSNTAASPDFSFLGTPSATRATAESTGGAFYLAEHWAMPPGFGSPYHTHHDEDESFYVLEGEIAFIVDGAWQKAGAGTFVFGPREIAHGFKVVGASPARMLLMTTPGRFEGFVRALAEPAGAPPTPPDMGRMMAAAAQYHIDIHGPLPESPAGW